MSFEPAGGGARQEEPLWTADEVATYLRVSRSWVYQHAEAGTLPVIRLPGSSLLRFGPAEIRAYARGEWKPPKVAPLRPLAPRTT
jgi:excisionase family DNA binding protein